MLLTRREFLQAGAASTALALAGEAFARPARAAADFSFVVLTDLHYRDARCAAWVEQRVLPAIRKLHPRPEFVMLAGDLSEFGTAAELGAVKELFATLPVRVRHLIGNHDYTEDGLSRAAYEQTFGRALNYRFDVRGVQFLAFDSTQGRSVYRTKIPVETLGWLDATLPTVSRTRPVILLTHFPMGRNWLRPVNTQEVLGRLHGFPLQATFSGHWHGWTQRVEESVHLSTGRCCSWWRKNHDGSDLKGFAWCHVRYGAVTHEFVAV